MDPLSSREAARSEGLSRLRGIGFRKLVEHLRPISVGEWLLALALVLGVWLPGIGGGGAWIVPVAAIVVLAAVSCVRERRLPRLSRFFVAYVVAATATGLHGSNLNANDVARPLLHSLSALGVAVLITTSRQRARVMALITAVAAVEVPVTAAQALDNVIRLGSHATAAVDSVTGTLGAGQAGVVTLLSLLAAAVLLGAWLVGFPGRLALPMVVLLVGVGVFSATRAVVVLAPFTALALGVQLGWSRPPRLVRRRVVGVVASGLLAIPVLYWATNVLYPGAFIGVVSSQEAAVLGGAAAQGIVAPGSVTDSSAAPSGAALLPGRFVQLRLAVRLSHEHGLSTFIVGQGFGSSVLDPSIPVAQLVPLPQRTGSTGLGRTLTETGWLGVLAFVALLLWLLRSGYRLWISAHRMERRIG